MNYYYLFTVILFFIFLLQKKAALVIFLIAACLFLFFLPSTGLDYVFYKSAYDNSIRIDKFPWFDSYSTLTAEKPFIRYTAFFGTMLPFGFPSFLVFNFLICFILSIIAFKKLKNKYYLIFFWMFFLPVIFPTLFYFSPRSSISFFLILAGFFRLTGKKSDIWWYGLIYLGNSIHSQFFLLTLVLIFTHLMYTYIELKSRTTVNLIHLTAVFVLIFYVLFTAFSDLIYKVLIFLPNTDFATAKFRGLVDSEREGFRISAVLSILVYPFLMVRLRKKYLKINETLLFSDKKIDNRFINFLYALIFYGAAINLGFLQDPHMAGRLSRLSEYVAMGLVLPIFFYQTRYRDLTYLALLFFIAIAPFLYRTLYIGVI